jgi:hypothetical protein
LGHFGGYRDYSSGVFNGMGILGYWWSSTASSLAVSRSLYYLDDDVKVYTNSKQDGFSVRCLRD